MENQPPQAPSPVPPRTPIQEFKPSIYPIMWWALAYGALAGVVLFVVYLLSQYITLIWFPVFLAGVVWGGYRNYKKQKGEWQESSGVTSPPQSPIAEFREAINDIMYASQEMMAEQAAEDEQTRQQAEAEALAQTAAEEGQQSDSTEPPRSAA